MSFSFGTPKTTGGLTLGTSTTSGGGLTFGNLSSVAATPSTGQTFGTATTPATTGLTGFLPFAPTTGLTFGATSLAPTGPNPTAPVTTQTVAPTPKFGFATPTTSATAAPLGGFSFGEGGLTVTPAAPGISLPATTAATSVPSAFPISAAVKPIGLATTTSSFGVAKTAAPTSALTSLWSMTQPQQSAVSVTTTLPQSTGFTLGTATTTASTGFSTGAVSIGTGFSLGAAASQPSVLGTTTATTSIPLALSSNVQALKPATSTPSVNFAQLEESINKWTIELEEQEKVFMNQVTQVNDWDRLLLANGDRIVSLNNGVEKVKLEQQQLDHELDFIVAQQRELEDCLLPLEKEFADITVSDPERDTTYRLAENLNTQLKQMSEDLKEVIEHINEKNKNQDTNDPIVQIGRILNAHMNSLQWVDQNTALVKQQLDQVNKLSELHRRDNDSTQNL